MKFDLTLLQKYVDNDLLEKNDHPSLPLSIYNYTRKTQFENLWDLITLTSRGLVLDNTGTVIAKSFPKFFNYEEIINTESAFKHTPIPNKPFNVYEKEDGSLGILFFYQGQWILTTRGSFTSDIGEYANKILQKYDYNKLNPFNTYLFEIVYPENRIVLNYDFEELIMLGAYNNKTNKEINIYTKNYQELGFRLAKHWDGINDFTTCKSLIADNKEGFVIRFAGGYRMKIKGEEYVRLHSLFSRMSYKVIWEYMSEGKDIYDVIQNVPDEMDFWIKDVQNKLMDEYGAIQAEAWNLFLTLDKNMSKKEFANWCFGQKREIQSILFNIYDNTNYSQIIWKIIKPKNNKLMIYDN